MRLIDADALKKRMAGASREWEEDFPHLSYLEKAVTKAFMLDIDEEPTVTTAEQEKTKAILRALHNAGGCDAEPGTWEQGYDDGISTAIEIVTKITGVPIEEVLE